MLFRSPASVLGVPLNQVIRVQEDASFASPSGKLQCRLGHDAAYCEGVSLAAAPDRSYCHAPTGAVSGVRIDGKAGWNCTGQATIFPTTDQAWWQDRDFPTVDILTSTYLYDILDRYADLAQLAERIHGKDEVAGLIPAISIL